MNINAPNLTCLQLQRDVMPAEGPKAIPINLDFTATTEYDLDYSLQQAQSRFSCVQTIWVDNFGNSAILQIQIPSSQQTLQIPAGVQGYFTVIASNPIRMIFSSTGATRQQVTLLNFPVFG